MALLDTTQPLALPEGTVRAIIAIMLTAGLLCFYYRWQWAPGFLEGIVATAIGFYFGDRGPKKDASNGNGKPQAPASA